MCSLLLSSPLIFFSVCTFPRPSRSTLFPYTTLFRSLRATTARAVSRSTPRLAEVSARSGRLLVVRLVLGARALSLRSEEHTSELQSLTNLVCRLLLEKTNHSGDLPGT